MRTWVTVVPASRPISRNRTIAVLAAGNSRTVPDVPTPSSESLINAAMRLPYRAPEMGSTWILLAAPWLRAMRVPLT